MRFAAVIRSKQQVQQVQRRASGADFLRRLVSGDARVSPQSVPVRLVDLPADLDQRVRLVGEW